MKSPKKHTPSADLYDHLCATAQATRAIKLHLSALLTLTSEQRPARVSRAAINNIALDMFEEVQAIDLRLAAALERKLEIARPTVLRVVTGDRHDLPCIPSEEEIA